jgi:signal transduction histidine kinase
MGLSISRSIVEAHGGRIRAALNPDHGLTVYVELPGESGALSAGRIEHAPGVLG